MSKSSGRGRSFTLLFLVLAVPCSVWAQNARGTINGVVKDGTGAVIPGGTVTVTDQDTGISFAAQTKSDGAFLVPNLSPGDYRVSAEAKGFKRLSIEGLKLDVGTTLTQDLVLEVGQVSETVNVTGTTSLVESTTSTVGTTVDVSHVLELPIYDRQVFSLINLVPGAFFTRTGDQPAFSYLAQFSIAGSRGQQGLALLDGVDNTRGDGMGPQTIEIHPPPDTLQEFRVQSNNLSAEYGRSGGGVVNAVIKNGTNQFHGDVYEFMRNDIFDAAGWGNTLKPELRRNTAGGTIGGPIRKNQTFFFFAFESLWNRQGGTATASVGLPEWYTGNFSTATRDAGGRAALVPIYDPATGGTQQFPNNTIPASRLDPVAVKAVQLTVPKANQTPIDPYNFTGNRQTYPVSRYGRKFYIGRMDHELDSKTKVFFRYVGMPAEEFRYGGATGDDAWGPAAGIQHNPGFTQNFALNVTRLFSPTFFLNFTAGVERLALFTGNINDPSTNYPRVLGIPNVPGPVWPQLTYSGGLVPVDSAPGPPNRAEFGVYSNYTANFTKVKGSHTFKFGAQYNRFNNNDYSFNGANQTFTFNGTYTQGVGSNGLPVANTGINLADFLLGNYTAASVSVTPMFGRRIKLYGGYFQDDWRVTPNLTLNLGLRYETQTPSYSPTDAFQSFDPKQPNPLAGTNGIPAGAMGITLFENKNGVGKYLWNWDTKDGFMPRFGFAYRVFGSSDTVIRGGYGIFYCNPTSNGTYLTGTLGFGGSYSASYTAVSNPSPPLKNGIPAGSLTLPSASVLTPTFGNVGTQFAQSSITFYYPNRPLPYTQNLNFTLQHQWKGMLIELGYLGNLGRHLAGQAQNINLVPPQLLSQTSIPIRLRRPFTIFTGTNSTVTSAEDNNGISNYNAFTVKLERRFKNGFSWLVTYTRSKWFDNINFQAFSAATLGDNNGPQNFYNRAGERSLASNDIPHRLVFSPVVELPFGKGKHWLNQGGVTNAVLGGWEVSVLGTVQTGSRFGPTVLNGGNNILGDPSAALRPDIVGDPNSPNKWQPAVGIRGIQYLNPAAFAIPAPFTYGNQSRTLPNILGPGVAQFNVMLAKNFWFRDRYRLQWRLDVIDVANTPQFSLPAESLSGSNFGIITATDGATRRILEFAVKLYW